jgi:tRNA(Ile)-lysidine synthase
LNDISAGMDLSLSVFHLDHMLRGEESAGDAAFVRGLAEDLGISSHVISVDVRKETEGAGRSPQDAARVVRLERLLDFADEWGADKVAVGHTADDQVETFLMRVVQGAGLTGLAAIGPVSGKVIRPLIEVWRYEIDDFLHAKNAAARLDRSNLELSYLRNRVRLKLLPCFVSEFGEVIKEVILREVESLGTDRDFFQEMARRSLEESAKVEQEQVTIEREKLLAMAPSLQRGVIREAWARLLPAEPMLSWQHVLDIMEKVVNGASGAVIDLPRSSVAEREYDDIIIRRTEPEADEMPPAALQVPGEVRLPWGPVIEASFVDASEVSFSGDPTIEYARADLALPLEVRTPKPGDRFRPLGSPYQRKLKDLFIDIKLPRRQRRKVPLVLEEGRVVWVAGLRLDDRYRLRQGDARAVKLRIRHEPEYDTEVEKKADEAHSTS